jgi:hypothetical protein
MFVNIVILLIVFDFVNNISYTPSVSKYLSFDYFDINFDHSYYLKYEKLNIIWFII